MPGAALVDQVEHAPGALRDRCGADVVGALRVVVALPRGTFSYRMTPAEIVTASGGRVSEQDAINNAGVTTWTLGDGRWGVGLEPSESTAAAVYPCAGTLSVDGDVATFTRTVNPDPNGDCAPSSWTARFAVKNGVLHWSAVSIPDFGWFFAAKPWHRIR